MITLQLLAFIYLILYIPQYSRSFDLTGTGYPSFLSPISACSKSSTSILISGTLDSPGLVECSPIYQNAQISSWFDLDRDKIFSYMAGYLEGNFTLVLDNLMENTTYDVYCRTKSIDLVSIMTFSEVKQNYVTEKTMCCSRLFISNPIPTLYTTTSTQYVFNLQSSGWSSSITPLTFSYIPIVCSGATEVNFGQKLTVYPSTLSLPASSKYARIPSLSFIISNAVEGCYSYVITSKDGSLVNTTQRIQFLNPSKPMEVPQLSKAQLSNDGSELIITFNSDTDKAIGIFPFTTSEFNCSKVVRFYQSNIRKCSFLSLRVLRAKITNVIASTSDLYNDIYTPLILSKVSLVPRAVKLYCSSESCPVPMYPKIYNKVSISPPIQPVRPTVIINGPSVHNLCQDLALDVSNSMGNILQTWKTIEWKVNGYNLSDANVTAVESYLNQYYTQSGYNDILINIQPVIIPSKLFVSGSTYAITLLLTNEFSLTGIGTLVVTTSSSRNIPEISLSLPSASIAMRRNQPLIIDANGLFSNCRSSVSFTANSGNIAPVITAMYTNLYSNNNKTVKFDWKVYKSGVYQTKIKNSAVTANNARFSLLPLTLSTKTAYTIMMTAVGTTGSSVPISKYITVEVLNSRVQAVIAGGNFRTINVYEVSTLDASASRDLDNPTAVLQYSWSCIIALPRLGDSCDRDFKPSTTSVQILSTYPIFQPGTTYLLQVQVRNEFGDSDTATIRVSAGSSEVPRIFVNSSSQRFNPDDSVALSAFISGTSTSLTTFQLVNEYTNLNSINDNIYNNIKFIAYSPVSFYTFAGIDQRIDFSALPNSLTAGVSYRFQLQSSLSKATLAYNFIDVSINSPPRGGLLSVWPYSGVSYSTPYLLATSQWVDSPEDYPILFAFFYYTSDSTDRTLVGEKSVASSTINVLGPGLEFYAYVTTVVAEAYDNFGAYANVESIAIVSPSNNPKTLLTNAVASIKSAYARGDYEAMMVAMGMSLDNANIVNCNGIVLTDNSLSNNDCATYFRHNCFEIAKTCGPCIDGYSGTIGHDNSKCFADSALATMQPIQITSSMQVSMERSLVSSEHQQSSMTLTALAEVGQSCSNDKQCKSLNCYKSVCTLSSKVCPNNCGSKGKCVFSDRDVSVRHLLRDSSVSSYQDMLATNYQDFGSIYPTLSSCPFYDPLCFATCVCESNYIGSDCSEKWDDVSISTSKIYNMRNLRENVCVNLFNSIQASAGASISDSEIILRVNTITGALTITAEVSLDSLFNCTFALLATFASPGTALCSSSTNAESVFDAFSAVFKFSGLISVDLMNKLIFALVTFTQSCQLSMNPNTKPLNWMSNNLRLQTSLFSLQTATASNSKFKATLGSSQLEKYFSLSKPTFSIAKIKTIPSLSTLETARLGISVLQFHQNFFNETADSTPATVFLSVIPPVSQTATSTSQINSNKAGFYKYNLDVNITLNNLQEVIYPSTNGSFEVVMCDKVASSTYTRYVTCSNTGSVFALTCPAGGKGRYYVTCPELIYAPVCNIRSSTTGSFDIDESVCEAVSFTSWTTTCRCSLQVQSLVNITRSSDISMAALASNWKLSALNGNMLTISSQIARPQEVISDYYIAAPALVAVVHDYIILAILLVVMSFSSISVLRSLRNDKLEEFKQSLYAFVSGRKRRQDDDEVEYLYNNTRDDSMFGENYKYNAEVNNYVEKRAIEAREVKQRDADVVAVDQDNNALVVRDNRIDDIVNHANEEKEHFDTNSSKKSVNVKVDNRMSTSEHLTRNKKSEALSISNSNVLDMSTIGNGIKRKAAAGPVTKFTKFDSKANKVSPDMMYGSGSSDIRTVKSFYKQIITFHFTKMKWFQKVWKIAIDKSIFLKLIRRALIQYNKYRRHRRKLLKEIERKGKAAVITDVNSDLHDYSEYYCKNLFILTLQLLWILFSSALFTYLFNIDDGTCELLHSSTDCNNQYSILVSATKSCHWREDNQSCEFRAVDWSLLVQISAAFVVAMFASVFIFIFDDFCFQAFYFLQVVFVRISCEYLRFRDFYDTSPKIDDDDNDSLLLESTLKEHAKVDETGSNPNNTEVSGKGSKAASVRNALVATTAPSQPSQPLQPLPSKKVSTNKDSIHNILDNSNIHSNDEFIACQTKIGTFMRSARLEKLRERVDRLRVIDEIDQILTEVKSVLRSMHQKQELTRVKGGLSEVLFSNSGSSTTSFHSYLFHANRREIEHLVANARQQAVEIRAKVDSLNNDKYFDMSKYLALIGQGHNAASAHNNMGTHEISERKRREIDNKIELLLIQYFIVYSMPSNLQKAAENLLFSKESKRRHINCIYNNHFYSRYDIFCRGKLEGGDGTSNNNAVSNYGSKHQALSNGFFDADAEMQKDVTPPTVTIMQYLNNIFEKTEDNDYSNTREVALFVFQCISMLLIVGFTAYVAIITGNRVNRLFSCVFITAIVLCWIIIPVSSAVFDFYLHRHVYDYIGRVIHHLILHSRLLLMRTRGLLMVGGGSNSSNNIIIQHLNPACRAARYFPKFPIAKLLLSVNDTDFSFETFYFSMGYKAATGFAHQLHLLFGLYNAVFPDAVQKIISMLFSLSVIYILFYVLYQVNAAFTPYHAIGIAFLFVMIPVCIELCKYYFRKWRKEREKLLKKSKENKLNRIENNLLTKSVYDEVLYNRNIKLNSNKIDFDINNFDKYSRQKHKFDNENDMNNNENNKRLLSEWLYSNNEEGGDDISDFNESDNGVNGAGQGNKSKPKKKGDDFDDEVGDVVSENDSDYEFETRVMRTHSRPNVAWTDNQDTNDNGINNRGSLMSEDIGPIVESSQRGVFFRPLHGGPLLATPFEKRQHFFSFSSLRPHFRIEPDRIAKFIQGVDRRIIDPNQLTGDSQELSHDLAEGSIDSEFDKMVSFQERVKGSRQGAFPRVHLKFFQGTFLRQYANPNADDIEDEETMDTINKLSMRQHDIDSGVFLPNEASVLTLETALMSNEISLDNVKNANLRELDMMFKVPNYQNTWIRAEIPKPLIKKLETMQAAKDALELSWDNISAGKLSAGPSLVTEGVNKEGSFAESQSRPKTDTGLPREDELFISQIQKFRLRVYNEKCDKNNREISSVLTITSTEKVNNNPTNNSVVKVDTLAKRNNSFQSKPAAKMLFCYRDNYNVAFYGYSHMGNRKLSVEDLENTETEGTGERNFLSQPNFNQLNKNVLKFQKSIIHSFDPRIIAEKSFRTYHYRKKLPKMRRMRLFLHESPGFKLRLQELNALQHPHNAMSQLMIFQEDVELTFEKIMNYVAAPGLEKSPDSKTSSKIENTVASQDLDDYPFRDFVEAKKKKIEKERLEQEEKAEKELIEQDAADIEFENNVNWDEIDEETYYILEHKRNERERRRIEKEEKEAWLQEEKSKHAALEAKRKLKFVQFELYNHNSLSGPEEIQDLTVPVSSFPLLMDTNNNQKVEWFKLP